MMCVRVYKNVWVSFLRLILHYLHFRCKRGKWLAIQLASTTSMAKSILPCGQAKTKKRRERELKEKKYPFHSVFGDPFVMQTHRCYCSVRWFWSSTLHQGINNKRQYSLDIENQGTFAKGEKWHKENDQINETGWCYSTSMATFYGNRRASIYFLDESFFPTIYSKTKCKEYGNFGVQIAAIYIFWGLLRIKTGHSYLSSTCNEANIINSIRT